MKFIREYMPPKKIEFKVVHVTSEDEKFPSNDLDSDKHGPLVHGWASQRYFLFFIKHGKIFKILYLDFVFTL